MENYTKYKLKGNDELVSLLAEKDHLFIVACNKCFKEFETLDEPECGEFEKIVRSRENRCGQLQGWTFCATKSRLRRNCRI